MEWLKHHRLAALQAIYRAFICNPFTAQERLHRYYSVTQGQTDFDFVLSRPPVEALVTEGEVKTVYSLSTDDRQDDDLFLITTKRRAGVFENELTLVNLDDRYYQNDSDIKNNLI